FSAADMVRGGPDGCSYFDDPSGRSDPLFVYYRTLANGTQVFVDAVRDPSTGLCFYPGADCAGGACCSVAPWVADGQDASSNIVNYGSLAVFVLCICGVTRWLDGVRARLQPVAGQEHLQETLRTPPSGIPEKWNQLGIYVGVFAVTFSSVAMADSTQLALAVPQRNSMLAAAAFLMPVKEIFQFLEDTTSVKIAFAMGTGNYEPIKTIVLIGVIGGLLAGSVGAALMTGIAYWPEAIEVLLAPGSTAATELNPGCSLLPSSAEVVESARSFWLLTCWTWPFQFCAMVLTGLLMGAREFALFGLSSMAAQFVLLTCWFFGPKPQSLQLLGLASFFSSVVFCGSLALSILMNQPLRRKYGLVRLAQGDSSFSSSGSVQAARALGFWGALADGVLAMTLDLVLQACGTSAVYVAGFQGLDSIYQLSAAGAAMPQYTAYAAGMSYFVKLAGSALIGRGAYGSAKQLLWMLVLLSILMGVISAISILPYHTALAGYYTSQACVFASDKQCLGVYQGLFAGSERDHTVFQTFTVFSVSVFFSCVFSVAKAALYACQDFAFMAQSGLVTFVVVFIPSLLIARLSFGTATALYAASALPTWILTAVFLVRLHFNLSHMVQGRHGPWSSSSDSSDSAESVSLALDRTMESHPSGGSGVALRARQDDGDAAEAPESTDWGAGSDNETWGYDSEDGFADENEEDEELEDAEDLPPMAVRNLLVDAAKTLRSPQASAAAKRPAPATRLLLLGSKGRGRGRPGADPEQLKNEAAARQKLQNRRQIVRAYG
ncbi:unnamed protein product, partial [Polarella glacialis]